MKTCLHNLTYTTSKATHVLFYKFDDEREKAQAGAPDQPARAPDGTAERESARPPMVRCYAVFNVEQADGLKLERTADDRTTEPEWKAHQTAERVIKESGVHVAHVRGDRAFYNMQTDKVTLPEREPFATANGYYQTALHELGHATGHPDRMNRDTLKHGVGHFGSEEYAREELRAEMSAMMTGERVGVGHDGSRGAAYVDGWITALDKDPKEIYKAAADAQKISDYLLRPIKEREQQTEQEHAQLAEKYSAARSPQISHAPTPEPAHTPARDDARPGAQARPVTGRPGAPGHHPRDRDPERADQHPHDPARAQLAAERRTRTARDRDAIADVGMYRAVSYTELSEQHYDGHPYAARRAVSRMVRDGMIEEHEATGPQGNAFTVLTATEKGRAQAHRAALDERARQRRDRVRPLQRGGDCGEGRRGFCHARQQPIRHPEDRPRAGACRRARDGQWAGQRQRARP